ncbi:hypothetical protein Vi05172_g6404 [Venturia inaequalis]|nr:hypothetical protein Vi05172_g6404 [Venturia inaequalis]
MRVSLILTFVCTVAAIPLDQEKKSKSKSHDKPTGLNWKAGLFGDFHIGADGYTWHPMSKDGKYDLSTSVSPPPGWNGKSKPGQTVSIPQGWGGQNPAPTTSNAGWGPAPAPAPAPASNNPSVGWAPPVLNNPDAGLTVSSATNDAKGCTAPPETSNNGNQDPPIFTYKNHVSPTGQIPRIHHCQTSEQWEVALQHLLHENVLGFDCEWKPDEIYPETVFTPENGRSFDELREFPMVKGEGLVWLPNALSRSDLSTSLTWDQAQLSDQNSISVQHESKEQKIKISSKTGNTAEANHFQPMEAIKEKCSVVQLGSETHIVVAHIAQFPTSGDKPGQLVPEILRYILGSPEIIKTGLEVLQDGNVCETELGVKVRGLRCLRVLHDSASDKKFKGMGGLATLYLQKRMAGKGDLRRQLSDWSLPQPLTEEQIEYAANDALISLLIHNRILDQFLTKKSSEISQILKNDMTSSAPASIQPSPIPLHLKSLRAKLTREKRHRANFSTLDTASKILYGNLRSLRDELMRESGLFESTQSRFVADTETIFLLAREKPTSIEDLNNLGKKIQKATREEYCYTFLNEVRRHLGGFEMLVEPEEFSRLWVGERERKRIQREVEGRN